jgi:hypothetical protein
MDGLVAPPPAGPLFLAKRKSDKKNGPAPGSGFGFAFSSGGGSATSPTSNQPRTRSLASARTSGAGTKVLRKAANLFDSIRKERGVSAVRDVYVRSPANSPTTYWFVGKIASSLVVDGADAYNDAHFQQAAVAQKRLIFEYAKRELRPQNLAGPTYSPRLELWLAPGNSEMDVVQNKADLVRVVGSASDLPDNLDLDTMGYNPEIYVGEERVKGGLRVERDEQGRPTKPSFDVQLPNED